MPAILWQVGTVLTAASTGKAYRLELAKQQPTDASHLRWPWELPIYAAYDSTGSNW
jgi:hypothetical protein